MCHWLQIQYDDFFSFLWWTGRNCQGWIRGLRVERPTPINNLQLTASNQGRLIGPVHLITFFLCLQFPAQYIYCQPVWLHSFTNLSPTYESCTLLKINYLEPFLFLWKKKLSHKTLYQIFPTHQHVFHNLNYSFFLHFIFSIPNEEPTFFLRHQSTYQFHLWNYSQKCD
jgi:hypothetical protein